jgi:predicted RNA methylase
MAKEKILGNDVRRVISELEIRGSMVMMAQMPRPLYIRVNEVLEAIGGKWSRREQAHLFEENPTDRIEDVLLTGRFEKLGRAFDFFETPPEVCATILERAWINPAHVILEPSAGRGAIVDAVHDTAPRAWIKLIEINPENCAALKAKGWEAELMDFLKYPSDPEIYRKRGFDRVVMNPPFSKQQDIDHVTHAFSMLKPGGRLVSVMGASVTFRTNQKTKDFERLVAANRGEVEPLPEGSFKASGTDVNTVLVTLLKG